MKDSVTIIGAGIAGMSAALRLLQAGYSVTVFEKTGRPGGQFSALHEKPRSRFHEHAFHIFADWNQNFFQICSEIGLRHPPRYSGDPEAAFEPQPAFRTLQPLPEGHQSFRDRIAPDQRAALAFKELVYLGAPKFFWRNCRSEVVHWSDMALYQYSVLDLLTDESLDDDTTKEFLNRTSVNGFMRSRSYASDLAALLHHELLLKVFAVPSYLTSARSYQTYLWHTAAFQPGQSTSSDSSRLTPSFWAMRGNVQETFWARFEAALNATAKRQEPKPRYVFRGDAEVLSLTVDPVADGHRITGIEINEKGKTKREKITGPVIMAGSLTGLKKILLQSPTLAAAAPELLDVFSLVAIPVPALDLYFRTKLRDGDLGFPKEHVTLLDARNDFYDPDPSLARKNGIASEYGLSLIDHSQLWPELGSDKTVLSVLAGDSTLLTALDDNDTIRDRVLTELRRYIYFDQTDLEDVHVQSHKTEPLFVNTVGSWQYRPEARLDEPIRQRRFPRVQERVGNLFMAGDYCRSKVDIVSVEGAIVTGICAAKLICDQVPAPLETPIGFNRELVKQAKAELDPWIDLISRRSTQNELSERARVKKLLESRRYSKV